MQKFNIIKPFNTLLLCNKELISISEDWFALL